MNISRVTTFRFSLSMSLLFAACSLFAAGGGSAGGGSVGGSSEPVKRKTPQEMAVSNYNAGLKNRDKAWGYQERASTESNAKKVAKLDKKANKQFQKAAKRFRTAIKYEPRLYQAHGSLGYALKQLGEFDDALSAYNLSVELKPTYTPAIEYRAEAHLALGRLDEIKPAYIQLLNLDRPRADQLMAAIQRWLDAPHDDIDLATLTEFRSWAVERITLSAQTLDLTGAPSPDWQPGEQ
ncbi:MAG: tetratricopeptide repeat protein [bacterium]|nr:tetratricopeptide repeat protein [Gammaproteobacteria bacterium]